MRTAYLPIEDGAEKAKKKGGLSVFGTQIAPGLYSWEAYHPGWREKVRSAGFFSGKSVFLIDPMLPPRPHRERIWSELDRLVIRQGHALHILLTVFWHERSCRAILARYRREATVWCPEGGGKLSVPCRRFRPEERLPGGFRAIGTARGYEVVFWHRRLRILIAGDVILGGKREPLRLCPGGWLPEGVSRSDLAVSLEPVLDLPVRVVLVGHGAHVTENASGLLASAIGRAKAEP